MRRGDADYAGQGVGTIESAVRATLKFHALEAVGLQKGEIDVTANVVDGYAVQQHLVGIAGPAADIERCQSAHLSRLHHLAASLVAQGLVDIDFRVQRGGIDDADGRAHLGFRRGNAGCGHNDVLRDDGRRQRKADVDTMSRLGEDLVAVRSGERLGFGANRVAARMLDFELKSSRPVAAGGGDVLAVLDESYFSSRYDGG